MPRGYVQAQGAAGAKFDKLFIQLERDIIDDIARRLSKARGITSSADWQLLRLQLLGNSSADIKKKIEKATGKTPAEVDALFAQAAQEAYIRDAALYSAAGKAQTPYAANAELQQLVRAMTEQTAGAVERLTRTSGFMMKNKAGRLQFTPASDTLNRIFDEWETAMLAGAFDYNAAIKKAVAALTNSGLRSVDYASGRSSRVDVAARRALLTGYGQTTSRVTFFNAQEIGTDLFEVAWHPGARPSHQLWQGRIHTRRELETVCGYGTVGGLCGANCRHSFYPFLIGVSQRQWPDSKLAALNKKENTPKEYKGKFYTLYQATQRQRALEVNMRAMVERQEALKRAKATQADIEAAAAKFNALADEYRDFSSEFDLPEQWERVG